jgi:hypothetical protein
MIAQVIVVIGDEDIEDHAPEQFLEIPPDRSAVLA